MGIIDMMKPQLMKTLVEQKYIKDESCFDKFVSSIHEDFLWQLLHDSNDYVTQISLIGERQ